MVPSYCRALSSDVPPVQVPSIHLGMPPKRAPVTFMFCLSCMQSLKARAIRVVCKPTAWPLASSSSLPRILDPLVGAAPMLSSPSSACP
eukprot:4067042-Pyramimonas_sp.AAC.1